MKIDRRRFPRLGVKVKAYLPGDSTPYEVSNISYKGCFIETPKKIDRGKLLLFEVDLPYIGKVPIYGIVVHHGTPEKPGLGIEIIEVDHDLTPVWALFIKAMGYIEEARSIYQQTMEQLKKEEGL
jgi:hypothetical protein